MSFLSRGQTRLYIWIVLALVAHSDIQLEQMNVKLVFLHGDLKEKIYMVEPRRFNNPGYESLVRKLINLILASSILCGSGISNLTHT